MVSVTSELLFGGGFGGVFIDSVSCDDSVDRGVDPSEFNISRKYVSLLIRQVGAGKEGCVVCEGFV